MDRKTSLFLHKAEREVIEKMLKEGTSTNKIARTLGRAPSSVYLEIRRGKGAEGYNAKEAEEKSLEREKNRNLKQERFFSEEDQKKIVEGINEGLSILKIAFNLGISKNTLHRYIVKNEIRYKSKNYQSIEVRLSALETQFEVLFEIVNDLAQKGVK